MLSEEAEVKFQEADKSYRAGRFNAAITILDELDRAFPNDRHILFPKARCLLKLKREDEAIALCDELIEKHKYRKAAELKRRIELGNAPADMSQGDEGLGNFSLSSLNIELEETPPESAFNKPRAVTQSTGMDWSVLWKVAAAIVIFAIIALWFYVRSQGDSDSSSDEGNAQNSDVNELPAGNGVTPRTDPDGRTVAAGPSETMTFEDLVSVDGVMEKAPVEYSVTTDCGGFENFLEKFAQCEPAMARMESPQGIVEYRVVGERAGRCALEVRFEKSRKPDWADKEMTCRCDPEMGFIQIVNVLEPNSIANGTIACTGPLAYAMRAMARS